MVRDKERKKYKPGNHYMYSPSKSMDATSVGFVHSSQNAASKYDISLSCPGSESRHVFAEHYFW
jgi:hypothetical protein